MTDCFSWLPIVMSTLVGVLTAIVIVNTNARSNRLQTKHISQVKAIAVYQGDLTIRPHRVKWLQDFKDLYYKMYFYKNLTPGALVGKAEMTDHLKEGMDLLRNMDGLLLEGFSLWDSGEFKQKLHDLFEGMGLHHISLPLKILRSAKQTYTGASADREAGKFLAQYSKTRKEVVESFEFFFGNINLAGIAELSSKDLHISLNLDY